MNVNEGQLTGRRRARPRYPTLSSSAMGYGTAEKDERTKMKMRNTHETSRWLFVWSNAMFYAIIQTSAQGPCYA